MPLDESTAGAPMIMRHRGFAFVKFEWRGKSMKLDPSLLASVSAMLLLSLAFASSALAAPSCKADVAKLCPEVKPGGGRIAQCLKQNEAQVSAPCKERIKMVAAQLKEVKEACADDLQQYCATVKPGDGRIAQCLREHKDKLSPECKKEIGELLEKKQ